MKHEECLKLAKLINYCYLSRDCNYDACKLVNSYQKFKFSSFWLSAITLFCANSCAPLFIILFFCRSASKSCGKFDAAICAVAMSTFPLQNLTKYTISFKTNHPTRVVQLEWKTIAELACCGCYRPLGWNPQTLVIHAG